MIKVEQNKTPITIKRLRFRHQRHGWKRTPWLSCIQKLKEKISMVLFVILEVSVHLTKKIVVWKWKKFTETNRNSFRGQLNPLVMNVKEKNEFHSASLWLSLIIAVNILVIYLKFVCSFHRLCFRSCCYCFLLYLLGHLCSNCRESLSPEPSLHDTRFVEK